ncbi:MAG: CDGSH iron-sulfur domain-containing protein [Bacteroidales bacterium]
MEPKAAQKAPYVVKLEEGKKYAWCACGQSKNQPYCDGSHKTTPFTPVVFTAGSSGDAYLCGCKQSGNKPYCDGTHKKI